MNHVSRLQPRPMLRLQRRLGADFSTYASDPQFAASWNVVSGQLQSEGASNLTVLAAKSSFANSFQQLTDNSIDAQSALNAAQQFVTAGHTVYGAVQHVQGFIAAVQGAPPGQVFQMFTGTLIGLAVVAGGLSAGIGAAIVAGVSGIIGLLNSAHFFGTPPSGTQICAGLYQNPPPNIQIGCVGTQAPTIAAGATNWRRFPKGSGGNDGDSSWYDYSGYAYWAGAPNGDKYAWMSYRGYRLIDQAFADYHYLACQSVPDSRLADFMNVFSQAWIANKEYALNGLKVQEDWEVLKQVARIWNRAHGSYSYATVPLGVQKPQIDMPQKSLGPDGTYSVPVGNSTQCPSNLPPLFQTINLYNNLSVGGENEDILPDASGLRINLGDLKTVSAAPSVSLPTSPPRGPTLVGHGAALAAGGLFGALAYGWATGKAVGPVFDTAWESFLKLVKNGLGEVETGIHLKAGERRRRR